MLWFGITERALIGVWLLWVATLAIALLRSQGSIAPGQEGNPTVIPSMAPR